MRELLAQQTWRKSHPREADFVLENKPTFPESEPCSGLPSRCPKSAGGPDLSPHPLLLKSKLFINRQLNDIH
ncbi:hypothetical protein GN956_G1960 [Arapaima gigas]